MYDSLIRLLSACLFQIIFKNNNCFIWGKPTQQEWKIEEAQSILYMEKITKTQIYYHGLTFLARVHKNLQ